MKRAALTGLLLLLAMAPSVHAQDIFDAVKAGDLSKVRALVEADSRLVQAKDTDGRTGLHWAGRGVHFEILKYLVEKGADVNAPDNNGLTPIHGLATRASSKGISFLIANKADVNVKNVNGVTPLHYAAQSGDTQSAKILLEHGADIDAQDNEGWSALHFAAYRGLPGMVSLLIEAGSDLNSIERAAGNTPLLSAIAGSGVTSFRQSKDLSNWTRIMTMLLENGAKLSIQRHKGFLEMTYAVYSGDPETIAIILDHGVEIPSQGEDGRRYLHQAALKGLNDFVKLMIEKGADYNGLSATGESLLHSAASGGLTDIVKQMASLGMDPNSKNIYGTAPLHSASVHGHVETVLLLLKLGADINIKTVIGETAFNLAQKMGHRELAEILEKKGADNGPVQFPVMKGEYLGQVKPGRIPRIFAPGIFACEGTSPHYPPVFSPDGTEIFWDSRQSYKKTPAAVTQTMRLENGVWTSPEMVGYAGVNPTLSPDGKRLFSWHRNGISISEKTGDGWSEPKPFESPFSGLISRWEVWLTKSGTLYFSSIRTGGTGGIDIYRAPLVKGRYAEFESLGNDVNSEQDDWGYLGGFAAPDESYLIFGSNRPGGFGSRDLYISFRKMNGTWTKAMNLGREINDESDQVSPYVSPDGRFLFYINRLLWTHISDIYWVDAGIIEELRQEALKDDK